MSRADPIGVGFYRKLESAVRDLPYFEGLIIGGSEQQIAITGKGSRFNRCRVRFKNVIMSLASVTCTYTVLMSRNIANTELTIRHQFKNTDVLQLIFILQ